MKGTVLVTGGAGSMGKLVVRKLLDTGFSVRVFDLPGLDYSQLEELSGVEIFSGDIMKPGSLDKAAEGVTAAVHLAALLPPNSEKDRDMTFAVNVGGSRAVAEALSRSASGSGSAALILSSSVSTYGDTTGSESPVTVDQKQSPIDIYGESKVAAEMVCRSIYPGTTILRISGVSVPMFSEPPEVWPFMENQRIEFIHRDDAVSAICSAVCFPEAAGQTYNISGGTSWRMTGKKYVEDYFNLLGVPIEEARYQTKPGWCDWYDTGESQGCLNYQNTNYAAYLGQIEQAVQALMEEFEE